MFQTAITSVQRFLTELYWKGLYHVSGFSFYIWSNWAVWGVGWGGGGKSHGVRHYNKCNVT